MQQPDHVKFLILGAGPTGLGAAYRLKELGESSVRVLEASSHVGGLASTFKDEEGFLWDVGGHVQFSHYTYFDELMQRALGADGWLHHERESWVWIRDRYIPYPFQNNIRRLPKEELWECLRGLIELYKSPVKSPPANFKEWIHATFGEGLARVFMEPYNFKVWAFPLEQLSFNWIGERVAVTDLERVLKNVLFEKDDVSWGPNNTFQFPKNGGTGAIWERVADLVGRELIGLNSPVQSVNTEQKRVTLSAGKNVSYEQLLNTIPLDLFTDTIEGFPADLRAAAHRLKFSSSNIMGIGLEGAPPETLAKKCWMYFPEDDCPFYRVTVFSNYSPGNVPDATKHWSLMAEVSESPFKPVNQATLAQDIITGLRHTKLLDGRSKIVSQWLRRVGHGYPTPSLERDAILTVVHAELDKRGVCSRGRFGGWKYEVSNQDHSLMQGVEWVNRVLKNEPELTYMHPAKANAFAGKKK
jgi:protoporphyrinogen oxidase